MRILLLTIVSSVIFSALNAQNVTHIDLAHAKFEETNAEKLFKEFRFIPLETHPDALLNIKTVTFYITDKYIIAVNNHRKAYLFDKETGIFIREVQGKDPNEYISLFYDRCGFDEKNNILYVDDFGSIGGVWEGINVETNNVETIIKRPLPENDTEKFHAYVPWRIKENVYVSYSNNRTGKDKVRLIVFDEAGSVIKTYPNYLEYNKVGISYPHNNGIFYYYNEQTYFKEWNYNDTVFCITEKNMSPHIIFESGDKQPSYYHQSDADYDKGKYLINFVYESDAYVLFSFLYYTETVRIGNTSDGKNSSVHTGYYDKKSKQAWISSTSDLKRPGYIISGIPVRFDPISINKKNEMAAKIDPEKLIKYKDDIDPKYQYLFQDMQEDDNPIVVIAKLKD